MTPALINEILIGDFLIQFRRSSRHSGGAGPIERLQHCESCRGGVVRSVALAAFIIIVAMSNCADVAAESADTAEFGIISPQIFDCFPDPASPPGCPKAKGKAADQTIQSGPIRISGEGSFGFLYDDGRISPEHRMKIIFEIGAQTDSGLDINSRISLQEDN